MSTRTSLDKLKTVRATDRRAWRAWLEKNHDRSPGVWLIYYKKTSGRPCVNYAEAVEEALCFGWIDSKVNTVDEKSYKQVFTPRKARSGWSKLNKARVARLIKEGRMTEAGLSKIKAAKRDGSWAALDDVEALKIPSDLEKALAAEKSAAKNFEVFSNTARKQILYWIGSARRPETRARRIAQTAALAARGEKPPFVS